MAGGPALPGRAAHRHPVTAVNEVELRELVPRCSASSSVAAPTSRRPRTPCRRRSSGRSRAWGDEPPADPKAWLVTVGVARFLDATRADAAAPPAGGPRSTPSRRPGRRPRCDDTLRLYFLCAHPDLTSSSAVALTLRAVGGLTTRQIAQAYLVPEATMAQRISRAKRTVSRAGVDRPGDVAHGDAGAVPGLQRGLLRRRRSGGRGDPAHPAARCVGRRPRGPRVCSP